MTAIDNKRNELPFLGYPVDEGACSGEMDLGDGRGRARLPDLGRSGPGTAQRPSNAR